MTTQKATGTKEGAELNINCLSGRGGCDRMSYVERQAGLIKDFRVKHLPNSKCWRRTHAHSDGSRRICKHQVKESYASLWTLLHEIGHLETSTKGMARAEQEAGATNWCIDWLRQNGLPVRRKYRTFYKRYIQQCLDRAKRRGLKRNRLAKINKVISLHR